MPLCTRQLPLSCEITECRFTGSMAKIGAMSTSRTWQLLGAASIIIASFSTSAANADSRLPPLMKGMTLADVSRLMGSPEERFEFESSRSEKWVYTNRTVYFNGGKVTRWEPDDSGALAAVEEAKRQKALNSESSEAEDILGAILQEADEGGTPAANTQAPTEFVTPPAVDLPRMIK